MRAFRALYPLLLGCTAAPRLPASTGTLRSPPPRVTDCPEAPALELFALRGESLCESFRMAGHITALALTQLDDDPAPWIAGELDVKGTRAFEARTRALAVESYASALRGGPPVAMALTLRGRIIARLEVHSAMRGRRFLLRVTDALPLDADTLDELTAALREDRRCRAGTEPPSP